jgi:hypothetical protein
MIITASSEELEALMLEEFKDTPHWALTIHKRGPEAVCIKLWSRWLPDFEWLVKLLTKYPSCWIKDEWEEEGGTAGVWIGTGASEARRGTGEPVIQRLEWDDMSIEEEYMRFKN